MQTLRNVAIILALALVVAVVPGGGAAAEAIFVAISIAFLSAIAWAVYRLYVSQQMTLMTIPDGRRAILYGSIGGIALLIAGYEQFQGWTGGVAIWIMLMLIAFLSIFVIWRQASIYT